MTARRRGALFATAIKTATQQMTALARRLAFKCTDEHMKCRNTTFPMGTPLHYRHPLAVCERGYHFCKHVAALERYKDPTKSRLFVIEYGAHHVTRDDVSVTDTVTLVEEVTAHTACRLLASEAYRDLMAENAAGVLLFLCSMGQEVDACVVDALIQRGAVNNAGVRARALQLASRHGHLPVVRALVDAGENIHADRDHALRWAAQCGHLAVVDFLVSRGADIHADDDYALRWASVCGHLPVVECLVSRGADVHARNDYALRWGAKHVVAYLRSQTGGCSDTAVVC